MLSTRAPTRGAPTEYLVHPGSERLRSHACLTHQLRTGTIRCNPVRPVWPPFRMGSENMDIDTTTLRATVRGFVQGVGFRVFVRSAAWHLNLRGYVRNLPDGTLQVIAAGPRPSLEKLLAQIWRGPAGAHITAVDVAWDPGTPPGLPSTFEVKL
jgi:acylphosphatase